MSKVTINIEYGYNVWGVIKTADEFLTYCSSGSNVEDVKALLDAAYTEIRAAIK